MSKKSASKNLASIPKLGLLLLLAITANSALAMPAYPIDVNKELHGTKIVVETSKLDVAGSTTILSLSNAGDATVECHATFDPRLEEKKTFTRLIKASADVSLTFSTSLPPTRLNIDLNCQPLES